MTVTTVGYGDKVPRSILGRVLGMFWILAGLFLIANFTAAITTNLTLEGIRGSINSVDNLAGNAVVTVTDRTASEYLSDQGIVHTQVETIEEAYEHLSDGRADALVYDAPVLQFYAAGEGQGMVQLVGSKLRPEWYTIALPLDSPYRKEINKAMLDVTDGGAYREISEKWFGE